MPRDERLDQLETTTEFAAALTDLRTRAGMSVRQVSRATDIPTATLGGYFSGRHLPTVSQTDVLERLLVALGVDHDDVPAWLATVDRVRRRTRARRDRVAAPYRGLESYGVDDAEWYVGREDLVARLLATVATLRQRTDGPRVLTVLGASGSGKSSLLRAGLAAQATQEGAAVEVMVPGADPTAALTDALARLEATTGPRLLIVDQVEELLASTIDDTVRDQWLTTVIEAADPAHDLVVVLALRADFFGVAVTHPRLVPLLSEHQLVVAPMDLAALERVITEPAARVGGSVEPELVTLLLRDVSARGLPDSSALPLLSHALLATWNSTGTGRLSVTDYLATGGVAGAVQRTAEEVYGGLDAAGAAAARHLFWQLVSVDDDRVPTRSRVARADLEESETLTAVIEAFVARRILTATETTLEISHEVLLDAWPRLREWVAEDRDDLALRRRVAVAAREWESHEREESALLRGPVLLVAADLAERKPEALGATEHEFVRAGLAHRDEAQRLERRGQRRLRTMLVAVAVLALVAGGLAAYLARAVDEATTQREIASAARDDALSRQVALQATQLRDSDPALAMQLAVAAYDVAPTMEARSAMLDVTGTGLTTRLLGVEGDMRAVASPDGELLAASAVDGTIRLYRHESGSEAAPTLLATVDTGAPDPLFAADFSPDGTLLAVGSGAGAITILDVSDPADPQPWADAPSGPTAAVQDVAFSPDGRQLWAATSDPGLFGWSLGEGTAEPLAHTADFGGSVQGVAVSPRGLIATGSADGTVRLWRRTPRGLALRDTLPAGTATNWVNTVAFSPDGSLLAAGARDRRVRVWDVTGTPRPATNPLTGFPSYVNAVAFDADGARLGVAGSSGAVEVWDTSTWTRQQSFSGATNYTSIDFVAGAEEIVTGSIDGVTRLWRLDGPRLSGYGDTIWALSYTADGDTLYLGVGLNDPQVVQVDASDPGSPRPTGRVFRGPPDAATLDGVVAVSPSGDLLVAGTTTGDVAFWHLVDGAQTGPATVRHDAEALIENVQFSPDGRYVATAADDGSVTVYDAPASAAAPTATPPVLQLATGTVTIGLGFNHDASLLAAGTASDEVRLWALADGEAAELDPIVGFDNDVYSVVFSPDQHTLLTGGVGQRVRLWDLSDPAHPTEIGEPLRGPTDTVWGISPNDDGSEFTAASSDGRLWVWSYRDQHATLRASLGGLGQPAYQVAHHPGAVGYAGAGAEGTAAYWTTDVDAARAAICATAGTPITETEWSQFVPGAPYAPPC